MIFLEVTFVATKAGKRLIQFGVFVKPGLTVLWHQEIRKGSKWSLNLQGSENNVRLGFLFRCSTATLSRTLLQTSCIFFEKVKKKRVLTTDPGARATSYVDGY